MRVCLDLRMVGPMLSGIPRFAVNLAAEMVRQAPEHEFVFIVRPDPPDCLPQAPNVRLERAACPIYGLREQFVMPGLLKRLRPDVFHAPTYAAPLARPCPLVMTIFDLIPMRMASEYGLRHRLYYPTIVRWTARRAACVTTTSECSRRDVHQLLGVPLERIVVAPCAVDPVFRAPRSPAATARPYLLTLGNDKPHKDMTPALDALEALAGRHDMDLVLVGALSPRLRRRVVSSAWRPRIRAESYVTDERLAELYAGAAVFVFPSRFEGFGLPPLEAMACGAPVAAFDTPAVAETCGDAARLVPVGDAAALTQAVADLLENPQARRDLIEAGRRRAAGFSWSETARRMLDVYRRALA